MQVRVAVPEAAVGPKTLEPALEAVTAVDEELIRGGHVPLASDLIAQGYRWAPEPPGDESFDHGLIILGRGWGDCDDWAPLHAASLRVTGEDPGARAVVVRSGPKTWHAVVRRSDGSIDDPSLGAGMPSPDAVSGVATTAPLYKLHKTYVGLVPYDGGWSARIDVPIAGCSCGCACSVCTCSEDPRSALVGAAESACMLGAAAGAAVNDTNKLYALAQLARGISQRQLTDHVDPDLLLAAVILNQTFERKLEAWHTKHRYTAPAGVVVGTMDDGLPHGWARGTRAQGWWSPAEVGKKKHHWSLLTSPGGRRMVQVPTSLPSPAEQFRRWPFKATRAAIEKAAQEAVGREEIGDSEDTAIADALPYPPELRAVMLAAERSHQTAMAYDRHLIHDLHHKVSQAWLHQHGMAPAPPPGAPPAVAPSKRSAQLWAISDAALQHSADVYYAWYQDNMDQQKGRPFDGAKAWSIALMIAGAVASALA